MMHEDHGYYFLIHVSTLHLTNSYWYLRPARDTSYVTSEYLRQRSHKEATMGTAMMVVTCMYLLYCKQQQCVVMIQSMSTTAKKKQGTGLTCTESYIRLKKEVCGTGSHATHKLN